MPEESEPSHLDAEKCGHILRLYGEESDEGDKEAHSGEKRALLEDLLADPLPPDRGTIETLPTLLKRMYQEMPPILGNPLGRLLLSPDTRVEDLIVIKEHAKKMMSTADSDAKYQSRAVIYYAAIASALAFHDRKITTHAAKELEDSLSALIERDWLTADLSQLLKQGRKACHTRDR